MDEPCMRHSISVRHDSLKTRANPYYLKMTMTPAGLWEMRMLSQ